MVPPSRRDASFAAAVARLQAAPPPPPTGFPPVSDRGAAAVLVALFRGRAGAPCVILTRRADHLNHHAGEVALPGGKLEAGETPVDAALREAEEEIGLDRARVRVVATFPPVLSKHRLNVHVVVGAVDESGDRDLSSSLTDTGLPPGLRADPSEVASVFPSRLDRFVEDAGRTTRVTSWGPGGPPFRLHWFDVPESEGAPVWGLTAGLLITVAEHAFGRAAPFEVHAGGVRYGSIVSEAGGVRVRE